MQNTMRDFNMGMDRGHSEPCSCNSQKLDLMLKHHINDFDLAEPDQAMGDLVGCMDTKMLLMVEPKLSLIHI
eukprot:1785626-Alexandrium_andersonii.AAC.1